MFKKIKLKQRLIMLFILLGLAPFIAIGIYSYRMAKSSLSEDSFERLTSISQMKKSQIEKYFTFIKNQAITLSEDKMAIEAMKEFSAAFLQMEKEGPAKYNKNEKAMDDQLMAVYTTQAENTPDVSDKIMSVWWPKDKTTRMFQSLYIASNPFPHGQKEKLDSPQDGSTYSAVHQRYHPIFRKYAEAFGYYDLFLIDLNTGYIVYTVDKELDFATSLISGPYSDSNLAKAFEAARTTKEQGFTKLVDYAPYGPSRNAPASFIASPIYDGEKKIGILAFQMPTRKINDIMTNNNEWEKYGFGKTGESYLIGDDFLMKTDSRYLIEYPEVFFKTLKEKGIPQSTLDKIKKYNTTIGLLKVEHDQVKEALGGATQSNEISVNYMYEPVLVAHTPLNLEGVKWALMAEITEKEAFDAPTHLYRAIWIAGGVLAVLVIALGWLFSRIISAPLKRSITNISTSTTEISATVEQHERTAVQQASAVNETTTTMDELGASFKQSAEQARSASEGAQEVLAMAEEGNINISKLQESMGTLKDKVEAVADQILQLSEKTIQIEDIANLVTDFASETKMLAMNAAVEAVRAGEHGKGFSVVAMEIRKLADQSKKSAERINSLVREIQKSTNTTVMVTEEGTKNVEKGAELAQFTADTFLRLSSVVRSSSESIQQISLNVQQQAAAIKQVVEAMNSVNRAAKETSAGISQTRIGVKKLNEVAVDLKEMV